MPRVLADLPPTTTIPRAPVAEIASYGATTVWVDPARGVLARRDGRTTRLKLAPAGLKDLDVGPGADGRPVLVYARCSPSCNVFTYTLTPQREARVAAASQAGVSERLPTVWRGTIAFTRGGATYTTRLGAASPLKKVFNHSGFDDLELGPEQLAFSGEYSSEDANGQTSVDVIDLAKPTGDWKNLDFAYVGEGSAAGFSGITADDHGFWWQRASRNGCGPIKRLLHHHSASTTTAPLATRFADPPIPPTPESEHCSDG
jgi:hypothetical protein